MIGKRSKGIDISTLAKLNEEVKDATLVDQNHTHTSSQITDLTAFPAPYLENLIPDSHLPNATGNFILKGSFFTKNMTVAIAGQTVNYVTFISDNEVHVNVTTGSTEGNFDVTLNNGTEAVFKDALLIVLGTVYKPVTSDWLNLSEPIEIINNSVLVENFASTGSAEYKNHFVHTKNWRLTFRTAYSPLRVGADHNGFANQEIRLKKVSDSSTVFTYATYRESASLWRSILWQPSVFKYKANTTESNYPKREYCFELNNGVMYFKVDGVTVHTFSGTITESLKLSISVSRMDYTSIKYIELAS